MAHHSLALARVTFSLGISPPLNNTNLANLIARISSYNFQPCLISIARSSPKTKLPPMKVLTTLARYFPLSSLAYHIPLSSFAIKANAQSVNITKAPPKQLPNPGTIVNLIYKPSAISFGDKPLSTLFCFDIDTMLRNVKNNKAIPTIYASLFERLGILFALQHGIYIPY